MDFKIRRRWLQSGNNNSDEAAPKQPSPSWDLPSVSCPGFSGLISVSPLNYEALRGE